MSIYLINISLILVYAFLAYLSNSGYDRAMYRNEQYRNVYSIMLAALVILQLFSLSVTKSFEVGYDTSVYARGFTQFSEMGLIQLITYPWEFGYVFLNKLVSFTGLDFRFFLFIFNLIFYTVFYIFLIKESKIPWLSLFLFITFDYFAFSLSVYRQSLALIITLISIKYIRNNSRWKFFVTILFASLFHQSAILFLIVYPVSKIGLTKKFYLLSISLGLFFWALGGKAISLVLSIYNRSQTVVSGSGQNYFLMLLGITLFGISLFYLYKSEVSTEDVENVEIYIQLMVLAVILQVFSFHLSVFVRVVYYFSFYLIVFIPNLLVFIPKGVKRKLVLIGIFVVGLLLYLYFLYTDTNGVTPYNFFWQ